jgi:hypothetical protein
MGTSISYSTIAPVPDWDRPALIAALNDASNSREWWAEAILLFDNPHLTGHVCGDTKLFCLVDDIAVDCFMATKDAEFIVETLEAASKRFEVDWQLSLAGVSAGKIINGRRDDTVQKTLSSFALISDVAGDFDSYDRADLLHQYPDR